MAAELQNGQAGHVNVGDFCSINNIPVHYPGVLLAPDGSMDFLAYPLPRLLLQLFLIFSITQSMHVLLRRFNMPRVISEIMTGLILGSTVLGRISPRFETELFPDEGESLLEVLSKVGFTFFMFLVGVKMDPFMVRRSGSKSLAMGLSIIVLPAIVSYTTEGYFTGSLPHYRRPSIENVMSTQLIIPFPVIANLLVDLKIMNSELGRLALASALVSHLVSAWLTNFMAIFNLKETGWDLAYESLTLSTALIVCTVLIMRYLALYMIRNTSEGKPVKRIYTGLVAFVVLLCAVVSDNVGLQYHFGPFVLGLTVPDGPPLGSTLVERWETMVSGMLAPLMVTFCASKVDLFLLFDLAYLRLIWLILLIMFFLRIMTVFGMALLSKVPLKDAIALSLILNIQGIVEIAIYNDSYRNQTIDRDTFSMVVLSVFLIALGVTLLVRIIHGTTYTYQGYERRSILYPAYNLELRILACVHRQDDALASIKILENSNPTKDSPITAYALNLVELVGRATPLLINHGLGQKASSRRSQETIDAFQMLERRFSGLMTAQAFTAVSLPRFMHHDICSLAFEKLVSLIILPFHKKWNQTGQVVMESTMVRTINQNVIEMAPCSVAVLVDRRKIRHESAGTSSTYHVGVVFLGGEDDREALALSKRMSKSSEDVEVTVVRLVGVDAGEEQWDAVVDSESLKEMKMQSVQQNNVLYKEEKVRDGPDMVKILNAMEEAFDLIIVGRRHKDDSPLLATLAEWSELPELGTIGDVLASSDIKRPVSVLVVQQQILRSK